MNSALIDAMAQRVAANTPRRAVLGLLALAAGSSGVPLTHADTQARRKKKPQKKCPVCPPPPSPPPPPGAPFSAGKNVCSQATGARCEVPGGTECVCVIRADNAASYCGVANGLAVANCATCTAGTVCVMNGGDCGGGFRRASPCPNPR